MAERVGRAADHRVPDTDAISRDERDALTCLRDLVEEAVRDAARRTSRPTGAMRPSLEEGSP